MRNSSEVIETGREAILIEALQEIRLFISFSGVCTRHTREYIMNEVDCAFEEFVNHNPEDDEDE